MVVRLVSSVVLVVPQLVVAVVATPPQSAVVTASHEALSRHQEDSIEVAVERSRDGVSDLSAKIVYGPGGKNFHFNPQKGYDI